MPGSWNWPPPVAPMSWWPDRPFNAGRYGAACGALALAWQRTGRPAVTAMNVNNPGVELFSGELYIVKTSGTAASMNEALAKLADLAIKLARGAEIGPASVEGYFPREVRRNLRVEQGAPERAVEMLLEKLAGRPFQTELPVPKFGNVPPAPPVEDLPGALVALVTESGLVPLGNPDRLETWNASKWLKYPIGGLDALRPGTTKPGTAAATPGEPMTAPTAPCLLTRPGSWKETASSGPLRPLLRHHRKHGQYRDHVQNRRGSSP